LVLFALWVHFLKNCSVTFSFFFIMELQHECINDLSKDGVDLIALKATFARSKRSGLATGICHQF
jgi:hypothetical protein